MSFLWARANGLGIYMRLFPSVDLVVNIVQGGGGAGKYREDERRKGTGKEAKWIGRRETEGETTSSTVPLCSPIPPP